MYQISTLNIEDISPLCTIVIRSDEPWHYNKKIEIIIRGQSVKAKVFLKSGHDCVGFPAAFLLLCWNDKWNLGECNNAVRIQQYAEIK